MKPLRARLQEARKRLGLPWEILERDYLLSWVLAGITQVDCVFRPISAGHSSPCRPVIPGDAGHPFRRKPATRRSEE